VADLVEQPQIAVLALNEPNQLVVELHAAIGQEPDAAALQRRSDLALGILVRMGDRAAADAAHRVGAEFGRLGKLGRVPVDQFERGTQLARVEHRYRFFVRSYRLKGKSRLTIQNNTFTSRILCSTGANYSINLTSR
jgi:hypothetical protein